MLKIAVVNPFDPMPGEPVGEARYATLCRLLAGRGHRVHWFSSDFSHLFKRPRDTVAITAAAQGLGYRVTLAPARAYRGNVSLARLASHRRLARDLEAAWRADHERFDVVLVSTPPPGLALAAARWARSIDARLVIDVQDLWPETFARFWPAWLRGINRVAFAPLVRQARGAYRLADGLAGVADGYIDHARPHLRPGVPTAMLPLGVDLAAFDGAVRPLDSLGIAKPTGQTWLFTSGSLGRYISIEAILTTMTHLHRRGPGRHHLNIVGSGDAEGLLRQQVQSHHLDNVTLHGRVSDELFASMAAASDVALLPIRPDAHVFLPNRVFQYFAAGLPVVSTIPGQMAAILREHQAGLTCAPSDGEGLADAVESLVELGAHRPQDHQARRGLWAQQFDRTHMAGRFADFIETVASSRRD